MELFEERGRGHTLRTIKGQRNARSGNVVGPLWSDQGPLGKSGVNPISEAIDAALQRKHRP